MRPDYMHIAHTWTERKIKTEQDFDAVLDNYRILFAYHSNAIEDAGVSMHQTREIFENGKVTNYTGELRHLFETQNQKVCYEWLKSKIVKQEKVTPDLICQIHERLCHGCYDETRWTKEGLLWCWARCRTATGRCGSRSGVYLQGNRRSRIF